MANSPIRLLPAAKEIMSTDLLVLDQNGIAKKVEGQVLIAFLTALADGHGGISSISKTGTEDLVDSYRIKLADGESFDFTVTNGEKGDKGDDAYIWIRYAREQPSESYQTIIESPDNWMGIYVGSLDSAPDDWTQYQWFKIKGEKGDTGDAAEIKKSSVTYQVGTSGSEIPNQEWLSDIPDLPQGSYLWSKTEYMFNSGDPIIIYSVSRIGKDGLGTLRTLNGLEPDENGNINITIESLGGLSKKGDTLEGDINAGGNKITGLPMPNNDTDAVPYECIKNMTISAWSNTSITTFRKQTLTLDDTALKGKGNRIRIVFKLSSTNETRLTYPELYFGLDAITHQVSFFCVETLGTTYTSILTRNITINRVGDYSINLEISDCYANGKSQNNAYMLPVEISITRDAV